MPVINIDPFARMRDRLLNSGAKEFVLFSCPDCDTFSIAIADGCDAPTPCGYCHRSLDQTPITAESVRAILAPTVDLLQMIADARAKTATEPRRKS